MLPTPGVAFLTEDCDADLGVMLSASHNPMPDNGIKFFARGGNKLDDALEDAIESRLVEAWPRPTGAGVGRVTVEESLVETYVAHLVNSLGSPVSLEGIKVVVDCANGAAYQAAPAAFEAQGLRCTGSMRSQTASTSTRIAAPPIWTHCDRRCWNSGRTSGSHSMGMPIAAWRSTHSAGSSTATRSWRSWLSPCAKRADSRTTRWWPP